MPVDKKGIMEMSRTYLAGLAGAATVLLAATGTTLGVTGQDIDQPIIGTRTLAGGLASIQVTLSDVNTAVTALELEIFTVERDGDTTIFSPAPFDAVPGLDIDRNGVPGEAADAIANIPAGTSSFGIILPQIGGFISETLTAAAQIGTGTGNDQIVAIGVQVNGVDTDGAFETTIPTGPGDIIIPSGFVASAINTEQVQFVRPNVESIQLTTAPALVTDVRVSEDAGTTTITIIHNRPLRNTTFADIAQNIRQINFDATFDPVDVNLNTNAAYEFSATDDLSSPNPIGTADQTSAEIVGSNNNAIQFEIATANLGAGFGVGSFVGAVDVVNDSDPLTQNDLRDYIGFEHGVDQPSTGTLVQAVEDLELVGATFDAEIAEDGGPVADALRATFNNSMDIGGDADNFELVFTDDMSAVDPADLLISGPGTVDLNDPNSVLFPVSSPGGSEFGIGVDGRTFSSNPAFDNRQITLMPADSAGTVTEDLFGGTVSAMLDSADIADGIAPQLAGGFATPAFADMDGNGVLDAYVLVFGEAVALPTNTGFTLNKGDGSEATPFGQIDPITGALPNPADFPITGTELINVEGVSLMDVDVSGNNTRFDRNNGVVLAIDPLAVDWNGADGPNDAMESLPGTPDADTARVQYDATSNNIQDAAGNFFGASVDDLADIDLAGPVASAINFYAGDNQNSGSNDQFIREQDGTPGDSELNDRLAIVFGEDVSGITAGTNRDLSFITLDGEATSNNTTVDSVTDNIFTFVNDTNGGGAANDNFNVGAELALVGNDSLEDGDGNPVLASGVVMDAATPYVSLNADGDFQATLVDDAPTDGIADRIFLVSTGLFGAAELLADGTQFTISGVAGATIDAAEFSGATPSSIIILTLGGSPVSMSDTPTLAYLGSVGDPLTSATNGFSLAAVDGAVNEFQSQAIAQLGTDTEGVAMQVFEGNIVGIDGQAVPIGTKIDAFVTIPVANRIVATHNGIPFVYENNDLLYGSEAEDSLEAFTNLLVGWADFVYLHRYSSNEQYFSNFKDDGEGDYEYDIDIMVVNLNTSRLTFTGTGEDRNQTLRNGAIELAWDFIRSDDGTLNDFYEDGYEINGPPVGSSAIIDNAEGNFSIVVSGPASVLKGGFNTTGNPIVFVVTTPDGVRYAVSSLLTSASTNDFDADNFIGDSILFAPSSSRRRATAPPPARPSSTSTSATSAAPPPTRAGTSSRSPSRAAPPPRPTDSRSSRPATSASRSSTPSRRPPRSTSSSSGTTPTPTASGRAPRAPTTPR